MTNVDARDAYRMWISLVRDEELYDATIAGTHASLAESRKLSAQDLTILDEFRAQPGLRWNVENLRFRAASHVAGNLHQYLQRTLYLLTRGDENWIQELVFEYLAYHRWDELGHEHLKEAERFGAYVRSRVLKRRVPPPHIDAVLDFELALVRHLRAISALVPGEWPARAELAAEQIAAARPAHVKTSLLLEVPVDITDWIRSADPRTGEVRERPISVLAVLASPTSAYQFQLLPPPVKAVYERCDGATTTAEIATALGDDYDVDDVVTLVGRWLRDRALTVS